MRQEQIPWKATPDVFVVTAPPEAFIDACEQAMTTITLPSTVPGCSFLTHVRRTAATNGRALVVSDVAEFEGGLRQTAVVVSAVVDDEPSDEGETRDSVWDEPDDTDRDHDEHLAISESGERLLIVRTHLEDQHTPYEGPVIVFDEHHDAIRAGLVKAVLGVEPGAEHRSRPAPHAPLDLGRDRDDDWASQASLDRPRRQTLDYEAPPARVDLRQVSGIALLICAVVVLLLAIASGSSAAIVAGVAAAGILGYAGARVAGV
ncbi:MAG: hypothetical protein ACR2PK_13370 [Acidimicrobiales bacterium]